jgi:hypothetical protein
MRWLDLGAYHLAKMTGCLVTRGDDRARAFYRDANPA